MLVPIRCFNCNKILADKWETYLQKIQEHSTKNELEKESQYIIIKENNPKTIEAKVLDELGIDKICCRSIMLSTIDLTETLTKTSYTDFSTF